MPRHTLPLLLASLLGCADAAEDGTTSLELERVEQAIELLDEPWCEPFAATFCAAAARCGCEVTPQWPDDCEEAARSQCRRDLRRRAEALAEGGFLASRDGAPRCLELLAEATAECRVPDTLQFEVECRLIVPVEGEAFPRAGEACANGLCGRGLRCAADQVCRVPRVEGERCASEGECAAPFKCRADCSVSPLCPSTCMRIPGPELGGACGFEFDGCLEGAICHLSSRRVCTPWTGRCFSEFDCAETELCGGFDFATCVPRPGLGEFCGDQFRCQPGLACDFDTLACAVAPGLAEPCAGMEFGLNQCGVGLVCRDRVCALPGREGDTCVFGLAPSCATGLGCHFDQFGNTLCEPHHDVDEPCQSDEICGPNRFCDFATLTCQERAREGERCPNLRCVEGLQCAEVFPGEQMCVRVEAEGDPCSERCPTGLRCDVISSNSTCVVEMCAMLRL